MKKIVTIIVFIALVTVLCTVFVACDAKHKETPAKEGSSPTTPEEVKRCMENAGYDVILEEMDDAFRAEYGYEGGQLFLEAAKSSDDALIAVYFESEEKARAFYESNKESKDFKGMALRQNGRWFYAGYEAALAVLEGKAAPVSKAGGVAEMESALKRLGYEVQLMEMSEEDAEEANMEGATDVLIAYDDAFAEERLGEYLYAVYFKSDAFASSFYREMRGAAENEPSMILRTYGKWVLYGTESIVNRAIDLMKG